MKKTLVIIVILVLSAMIATFSGNITDSVQKKLNPVKYSAEVEKYSEFYGVPQPIIYAVIKTESSFVPDAVSHRGAIGLMQITPDTFSWLCSKTGGDDNSLLLYDPDTNIRYGTYFLSLLHNEYQSWDTVFAAYNAGRRKVNEWLSTNEHNNNGRLKNIPYKETREYVVKVSERASLYERLYFTESQNTESIIETHIN
ncbi:MAG: lytic transglycosylase domain-containing protein [Clostridia bacterium]|nr:lytic transglycosylase domain-containing protein [Clostridia bacterium]